MFDSSDFSKIRFIIGRPNTAKYIAALLGAERSSRRRIPGRMLSIHGLKAEDYVAAKTALGNALALPEAQPGRISYFSKAIAFNRYQVGGFDSLFIEELEYYGYPQHNEVVFTDERVIERSEQSVEKLYDELRALSSNHPSLGITVCVTLLGLSSRNDSKINALLAQYADLFPANIAEIFYLENTPGYEEIKVSRIQ